LRIEVGNYICNVRFLYPDIEIAFYLSSLDEKAVIGHNLVWAKHFPEWQYYLSWTLNIQYGGGYKMFTVTSE